MHEQDIDPAFGHWLAGFIDGEGCFQIERRPHRGLVSYNCSVAITLRADDRPLLAQIAHRTGIGKVTDFDNARSKIPNANPISKWTVNSKADDLRLVAILDAHPMQSKKARDYAIWREAVHLWCALRFRPRRGGGQLPRDWDQIASLRDELLRGRAYEPQPSRPRPPSPQGRLPII